jgi:hypothetical protein
VAIIGVFGTWRSSGPVALDGFEGPHNGWLVVVFGLIALAGVGAMSRGSWLGLATVLLGAAVMILTTVQDILDDNSVLGGHSGWGAWLTVAASVVLAGGALAAFGAKLGLRAAQA